MYIHSMPHILFSRFNCDSGTQTNTMNPTELDRQRTMAENEARMKELFHKKHADSGLPPEEFADLAHSFVYGASQKGTRANQNSTQPQQNEEEADPAYEPDDAEMANDDDEIQSEDDERNGRNPSSKVRKIYYSELP